MCTKFTLLFSLALDVINDDLFFTQVKWLMLGQETRLDIILIVWLKSWQTFCFWLCGLQTMVLGFRCFFGFGVGSNGLGICLECLS